MTIQKAFLLAACLLFSLCLPNLVSAIPIRESHEMFLELKDELKVSNLIVLMLENHSFDNMFGWMKREDPRINGLTGNEYNPLNSTHNIFVTDQLKVTQDYDPPHTVNDITMQIYWNGTGIGNTPTMMGFVKDAAMIENTVNPNIVRESMDALNPNDIPTSVTLAREFAIIDEWFSSLPGPTNPNRQYVHAATSHGQVDNDSGKFSYPQRPIYANLDEANITWNVYIDNDTDNIYRFKWFNDSRNQARVTSLGNFSANARAGILPQYTFIDTLRDHPVGDVRYGEELIKMVYEAVRDSPQWYSSMLLITFDEHGGFFDHVAPPEHVPNPDGINSTTPGISFDFTRLGLRVPTIVVSPWVPKGAVIHAPIDQPGTYFEHSSVPATLKKMFKLPKFLTKRDEWAATFDNVASLRRPRRFCIKELPGPIQPWPLASM